ncbi:hypothetical protein HDA40_000136 [Hamadaea flava]|uniref:DUF3558 domain-containing protein n=1 Tax=Hamadaea flava TaxID=1742688 RepID=A0ABV8LX48_9ACTN|nr:hypothetical protein [Hamadaea flava]MCP2321629.1 hypothetical protein [Hamadaea flava]
MNILISPTGPRSRLLGVIAATVGLTTAGLAVAGCGPAGGTTAAPSAQTVVTEAPSGPVATGESSAPAEPGAHDGIPALCLDEATIAAAVGFAVHVERPTIKQNGDAVNCTFLADDQQARPGANVSVLVAPAAYAEQARTDIKSSATRAGVGTAPVGVGQDGLAYESAQRSAAATVVGGRLVAVTADGMGLSSPGVGRRAVEKLVAAVAAKIGG